MRKQINILYAYYTNMYVEIILTFLSNNVVMVLNSKSSFPCPKIGQKVPTKYGKCKSFCINMYSNIIITVRKNKTLVRFLYELLFWNC